LSHTHNKDMLIPSILNYVSIADNNKVNCSLQNITTARSGLNLLHTSKFLVLKRQKVYLHWKLCYHRSTSVLTLLAKEESICIGKISKYTLLTSCGNLTGSNLYYTCFVTSPVLNLSNFMATHKIATAGHKHHLHKPYHTNQRK
jgi:hypothetical protein